MARAWMPLYIGDYLADTQHLTTIQHGAYLLLIMHYWQHGKLPNEEAAIAGISRLNRDQWRNNCSAIAAMFEQGWRHKRIDRELEKANGISEKRSHAGRKGAHRTNYKLNIAATAIARQKPTQSQSHIDSSFLEASKSEAKEQPKKEERAFTSSLEELVKAKGWVA